MRALSLVLCACAGMLGSAASAATEPAHPLDHEWVAVDPLQLASMRGGMQMPSGLALSFGFERVVYVNGQLVASARVHIADVARMSTEQAEALVALQQGRLIQNGAGPRLAEGPDAGAWVIQNTLDGQDIRAVTTLDLSVDTLGLLQQSNAYETVHNALITAPGGP